MRVFIGLFKDGQRLLVVRVNVLIELGECARVLNQMRADGNLLGSILAHGTAVAPGLGFSALLLVKPVVGARVLLS